MQNVNDSPQFWGICPNDSEPLCSRSYKNAREFKDAIDAWISTNCMPGLGYPRHAELTIPYQRIFRPADWLQLASLLNEVLPLLQKYDFLPALG